MLFHRLLTISLLTISFFAAQGTALAQQTVSQEEKVVLSFLKLSKQEPNYDSWITNSPLYMNASKFDKEDVLESETERLGLGYGTYDVDNDIITLKDSVRLTTRMNNEGKRILDIRFTDEKKNDIPHFSIPYGTETIALIPEKLENFNIITLKPEEIAAIKKYFYDSAPYEAQMEIRIKPKSADGSSKIQITNKEQWILLGEIAYLKIEYYDRFKLEHVTVWDYNAPWYLSESQKALIEMFRDKDESQ